MKNDITLTLGELIEIAKNQEKEINNYIDFYIKILNGDKWSELDNNTQLRIANITTTLKNTSTVLAVNLTEGKK